MHTNFLYFSPLFLKESNFFLVIYSFRSKTSIICRMQSYPNCEASNTPINCPKKIIRKKFTTDEDARLIEIINGMKDNFEGWDVVSSLMETRTSRQCRERWISYLSPSIRVEEWNDEEDQLLIELVERYGKKWLDVSAFFDGRSTSDVKNRWYSHLRNETAKPKRKRNTKIVSKYKEAIRIINDKNRINQNENNQNENSQNEVNNKLRNNEENQESNEKDHHQNEKSNFGEKEKQLSDLTQPHSDSQNITEINQDKNYQMSVFSNDSNTNEENSDIDFSLSTRNQFSHNNHVLIKYQSKICMQEGSNQDQTQMMENIHKAIPLPPINSLMQYAGLL
ncbi:hypothetical protein TRFO_20270 [Tritrichomonas foetus]|uniref:Myb-like DNA-binding domain containing protein n=1 Tax=Tritrichomonas foetus TaxID=1144522 RepID=A0A1J4KHM7_9EUKA|nr:hypothetical protein TRFO_20270 [Tritrichomonas foetus]|eukprot:OHT10456.1 hypothetical protein TRFO_20270 [Tritrichomonas foetus]